jgi:hypothetical protein
MSSQTELKLDWCTHEAAKYAVEHWHYSRRMPKSKLVKVGVWESGRFVGCVIYGCGATPEIGKPYGLLQQQICELVRVALTKHVTHTSRIVAIANRMVAKANPGLRLIVSFADTSQGHHGGIYQAGGWSYTGSDEYHAYRVLGEVVHPRTLYDRFGIGGQSIPWLRSNIDPKAERIANGVKHKYVMPLDQKMRLLVASLAKPYPKRVGSADSGTLGIQPRRDGANPISTLHHVAEEK